MTGVLFPAVGRSLTGELTTWAERHSWHQDRLLGRV